MAKCNFLRLRNVLLLSAIFPAANIGYFTAKLNLEAHYDPVFTERIATGSLASMKFMKNDFFCQFRLHFRFVNSSCISLHYANSATNPQERLLSKWSNVKLKYQFDLDRTQFTRKLQASQSTCKFLQVSHPTFKILQFNLILQETCHFFQVYH